MGLLARAIVWIQFKLGIYQLKAITKIERGGVVISCTDSRYQPGNGIRLELSPNEWFLYSYLYFPRNCREDAYDEEFITRELYYDIYAKSGPHSQNFRENRDLFAVFKNGHTTGYIIEESRTYEPGGMSWTSRRYSCVHINQWGVSWYKTTRKSGSVKPIYFVHDPTTAAICVLADDESFEKVNIDLDSLNKDCENSPGSCILHSKLTKLLQECNYAGLFMNSNETG